MTQPLLSVKNLKTHFFTEEGVVKAVDGISLDLQKGEILGIVGESGSGKSVANLSFMRLIPQPPGKIAGGEIWFEGENLLDYSEEQMRKVRGNRIAMIFQDPMTSLNPFLKISTQLTEVLKEHKGMNRGAALEKAVEILTAVGIPDPAGRLHDYPHQFSGGMRQRVMIAMGLLCQPQLLIADEPTTALDVTIQAQILDLLKKLQQEFHMAIILVTHDLGVAAHLCDNIAVMYAGRIIEMGTAQEIFDHPKHPYTLGLLRSIPRLDEKVVHRLDAIRGNPPDLARLPVGCPYHPRCDYGSQRCQEKYPEKEQINASHYSRCWEFNEVKG